MHFEELYKNNYPINSINFNKKLNWFFDIKYLIFRKLNTTKTEIQAKRLSYEYKILIEKKIINNNNNHKIIKTKKFHKKNISSKIQSKNKIIDSINFLKKNNFNKYFKHFFFFFFI